MFNDEICDDRILRSLQLNLKRAALCGLLLTTKDQCTEEELYCTITNLSYQGIIAMPFCAAPLV